MKNLFFVFCCLLFASCSTINKNGIEKNSIDNQLISDELTLKKSFENSYIYMQFIDLPKGYWTVPNANHSMVFNIFLIDKTHVLSPSNVEKIRIRDSKDGYWTLIPEYDRNSVGKWANFYSFDYSVDATVLSLEMYIVELISKNGKTYTRELYPMENMNIKMDNKIIRFIYSNTYEGKIKPDYLKSLERCVINSVKRINAEIDIRFSVNDERVKNGEINFYDDEQNYLGCTNNFFNGYSEQVHPSLNYGNYFYTDGEENIIRLKESDFNLKKGVKLSDIRRVSICLFNDTKIGIYDTDKSNTILATHSEKYEIISDTSNK